VGDEGFRGAVVEGGAFVREAAISQEGGGSVLHAAKDEVIDADLGVFGVGVGVAIFFAEELNHARGFAHADPGICFAAFFNVVQHRNNGAIGMFPFIDEFGKVPNREGHEVGGMHLVLSPVVDGIVAVYGFIHQCAVGYCYVGLRDAHAHF
jgi:hypothetical protein